MKFIWFTCGYSTFQFSGLACNFVWLLYTTGLLTVLGDTYDIHACMVIGLSWFFYSCNTHFTAFTEFFVVCASAWFSAKCMQLLSLLLHCSVQGSKILFTLFQRFVFLVCTVGGTVYVICQVTYCSYISEYKFSSRGHRCGNRQITNDSIDKNTIAFTMSFCFILVWFFPFVYFEVCEF